MSIAQRAKHAKCDSWMSNNRFSLRTSIKQESQAHYMYLQMDPLDNRLSTRPIQTGREFSKGPFPNGRIGFIDNLNNQFGARSVLTRIPTRRDGPELFLPPCTMGTAWIFDHSLGSLCSTSTTPLSTVLAGLMITSRYCIAICTVALLCVNAVVAPFALVPEFMILMWAGACWSKSALLIADAISGSMLLGSGTLSSVLRIKHQSAMLEPVGGAVAGLAGIV